MFLVVQCGEPACNAFQCVQERKDATFVCKICTGKNSLRAVYAKSNKNREIRPICQKLNSARIQREDSRRDVVAAARAEHEHNKRCRVDFDEGERQHHRRRTDRYDHGGFGGYGGRRDEEKEEQQQQPYGFVDEPPRRREAEHPQYYDEVERQGNGDQGGAAPTSPNPWDEYATEDRRGAARDEPPPPPPRPPRRRAAVPRSDVVHPRHGGTATDPDTWSHVDSRREATPQRRRKEPYDDFERQGGGQGGATTDPNRWGAAEDRSEGGATTEPNRWGAAEDRCEEPLPRRREAEPQDDDFGEHRGGRHDVAFVAPAANPWAEYA